MIWFASWQLLITVSVRATGGSASGIVEREPFVSNQAEAALQAAVERLYTVFARYTLRPNIEACECCHDDDELQLIDAAPLRQPQADQLMSYAHDAVLLWGDEDGFRHFLPRIFELITQDIRGDFYNPEAVFARLTDCNWRKWPLVEQEALEAFLLRFWRRKLSRVYVIDDRWDAWSCDTVLRCMIQALQDVKPLLDEWDRASAIDSDLHIFYVATMLGDKLSADKFDQQRGDWWDARPEQTRQIIRWLRDPAQAVR